VSTELVRTDPDELGDGTGRSVLALEDELFIGVPYLRDDFLREGAVMRLGLEAGCGDAVCDGARACWVTSTSAACACPEGTAGLDCLRCAPGSNFDGGCWAENGSFSIEGDPAMLGRSISFLGERAIVGAPGRRYRGTPIGSAIVLQRTPSGTWAQSEEINPPLPSGVESRPDEYLFGGVVASDDHTALISHLTYHRYYTDYAPFGGVATSTSLFGAASDGSIVSARTLAGYLTPSVSGDRFASGSRIWVRDEHGHWVKDATIACPSLDEDGPVTASSPQMFGDLLLFACEAEWPARVSAVYSARRDPEGWEAADLHLVGSIERGPLGYSPELTLAHDLVVVSWGRTLKVFREVERGVWGEELTLELPASSAPYRRFESVAIGVNRIAIGVQEWLDPGRVWVFTHGTDGWRQEAELLAPEGVTLGVATSFGFSVALRGETLLVGAPGVWEHVGGVVYAYERITGDAPLPVGSDLPAEAPIAPAPALHALSLGADQTALCALDEHDDLWCWVDDEGLNPPSDGSSWLLPSSGRDPLAIHEIGPFLDVWAGDWSFPDYSSLCRLRAIDEDDFGGIGSEWVCSGFGVAPTGQRWRSLGGGLHPCALTDEGRMSCQPSEPGPREYHEDFLSPALYTTITGAGNYTCGILAGTHRASCWRLWYWGGCICTSPDGCGCTTSGIEFWHAPAPLTTGIGLTPDTALRALSISRRWACGLRLDDASVICWGEPPYTSPDMIPIGPFEDIAVGEDYACALNADNVAHCWDADGQWDLPVALAEVHAEWPMPCGIDLDGRVRCF
jgi:hypothetical protein